MNKLHDRLVAVLGENAASSMNIFLVSTTAGENMDALKLHLQVRLFHLPLAFSTTSSSFSSSSFSRFPFSLFYMSAYAHLSLHL